MKPISKALFVLMGIGIIAPSYAADVTCRNVWSGTASYNGVTASSSALANCATWNTDTNNGYACGCATCNSGYSITSAGSRIGPYVLTHRCAKNTTTSSSGSTVIAARESCTANAGKTSGGTKYACNCPSSPRGGQTTPMCSASGSSFPCFVSGSEGDTSVVCSSASSSAACNICGCSDYSTGSSTICSGTWSGTGTYQVCSTAWSNVGVALPTSSSGMYTCGVKKYTSAIYRCNTGYYPIYTGSNGMFSASEVNSVSANCARCPQYKNKAGTTAYGTSAAGATSIAGCYFNTQTCSDTAGTYTTSSTSGTTDAGSCCPA